jgi:hypothetical protein
MTSVAYDLASTPQFWKSYEKLSRPHRVATTEAIEKVQDGHPSVTVHKLEAVPFVSFYVNKDAYRVICKRDGNLLMMCHVGAHDPAYDWAKRHKVAQIGRVVRILRTTVEEGEAHEESGAEEHDWKQYLPPGPLHTISDRVFQGFGIGTMAAQVLREVPNVDVLADLVDHFPVPRGEALLELALSLADLDAIQTRYLHALEKAERGEQVKQPSFRDAVADEINVGSVWHPQDKDAYRRALDGDFAAWRVFLHPSQHRVVHMKTKGALKVTGGPGTGKTVVGLHRAKALAERHEGQILLTTFNATLARQLGNSLEQLVGKNSPLSQRIEVQSLVKVAQAVLSAAGKPSELVTKLDECWQKAMAAHPTERHQRFFENEREDVLARTDSWTRAAYFKAPRKGRGKRLDRKARNEVWKVLEAFEQELTGRGGGDVIALCREATRALEVGETESPYRAVLCDEVQDMGAAELRLLAALASEPAALRAAGEPDADPNARLAAIRPDGLTLCGDGHQRIYRVPVTLRECGIRVGGGSSRKLLLNYRTTDAIRRAAVAVVEGHDLDGLDEDSGNPLTGYRSLRQGVAPESHEFESEAAEAEWVAERAREDRGQLLVLARTTKYVKALRDALETRGLKPRVLQAKDTPSESDPLLLATLHRAKGLEAPRVIIAGRQLVPLRYPGGGDARDRALWDRKERSLLYVGMTRARDWCALTGEKT